MYEKQNFSDGSVLTAEQLNHMETGIAEVHDTLPKKLTKPGTAKVGDYLRIKAIGTDGTMEVEAVSAPTVPTKVSELTNDAGYQTEAQVNVLIAAVPTFKKQVVAELPAVGEDNTLYLVPFAAEDGQFLEYLYVNGAWEVIGSGVGSGENLNPVTKTEDMTQPVGVDEDGKLWTAPTAGGGSEEESEDILLGTLPMTISESNCYLLSETNATISTGEGAAQLLDFDVQEPYLSGYPTYNGGAFEKIGKNTIKLGFEDVSKNAATYFDIPVESGKTYTLVGQLVGRSDDVADTKIPIIRITESDNYIQLSLDASGAACFKTFTATDATGAAFITLAKVDGYVTSETYATVAVYLYEGEHTEIPTGATFDIIAGEKYNTDGYMGATLSAVNGETVQVYQVNTSEAEVETDNGGVIFFGDSILHYSDVVSRYATKTGKSVVNCAVGGTRMSASRDSTNAYYPVDMANIADAIASGDFTAQLDSGVATAGFTSLASAVIGNYKAMVLEFGTNDFSASVPFEGDDATSIAGALRHILTTILTAYPNMRIVVLSTLQYVTLGTGTESGVPTHDDGTVWAMNEVIKGVCESDEFCVPFVDMYHAFGQNGITRNTLNGDGVHLTAPNGAKRYADILTAKLNGLGI